MRVIFYISALKDEVKVQEKKTQLELPSRQGKNPLPTQRRTQRSYSSRALGSRPPHASHSRAAPHRFTPFPSPARKGSALGFHPPHASHASPRIAVRRLLLQPSEAAGAAEAIGRSSSSSAYCPVSTPLVRLRPFDGFPIVRGCGWVCLLARSLLDQELG